MSLCLWPTDVLSFARHNVKAFLASIVFQSSGAEPARHESNLTE